MKRSPAILLQSHFIPRLQTAWNFAQLGFATFPLIPSLGALGIFLALVDTWRRDRQILHRRANWGLGILTLWLAISTIFAADRLSAVLGLFNFLPYFFFFAAFSTLIQTPAQLRRLAQILVITSIPVIILGFGQLFFGWSTPEPLAGFFGWTLVAYGNPPGRMASIFMYANVLAGYLVVVLILALGLWIAALQTKRNGVRNTTYFSKQPSSEFLLLSLVVAGNFAALILTNSRNAWAIATLAILVFAIYQGWRWLVTGVVAIAGTILLAAFAPSPLNRILRRVVPAFFWTRLTDQLHPNRPIPLLRTTQWRFAWSLTQQRPITGWGLRNFTPLYQAQMHIWLGHPHNLFLMLSAEIGIVGTALFCFWVGAILYQGIQILHSQSFNSAHDQTIFFSYIVAFFACVLFNCVDVTIFDLRINTLGWLLLTAIYGVIDKQQRRQI